MNVCIPATGENYEFTEDDPCPVCGLLFTKDEERQAHFPGDGLRPVHANCCTEEQS